MNINYEDEKFQKVEQEKNQAINASNETYDNMISNSDSKYNDLISATETNAQKQQELQDKNTQLQVDQINQNKDKVQNAYNEEVKSSYNDYQKEINNYGENAENMAATGQTNSGYSESSKVAMYSTYQNKKAIAKKSLTEAFVSYDNDIKEAQLSGDSNKAQIAANALMAKMEYLLQGFQYKNELLQTKLQNEQSLNSDYNNRYQQVYNNIYNEKTFEENVRQYNEQQAESRRQYEEQMAYQKERDKVSDYQWQQQYNLSASEYKKKQEEETKKLKENYYSTHNWTSNVAQELYKWADGGYPNKGQENVIVNAIEKALNDGQMSEEEADYALQKLRIG